MVSKITFGVESLRARFVFTSTPGKLFSVLRPPSLQHATEKLREMHELKESVRSMNDETSSIKEDFLHLKNHLNLAAREGRRRIRKKGGFRS